MELTKETLEDFHQPMRMVSHALAMMQPGHNPENVPFEKLLEVAMTQQNIAMRKVIELKVSL